MDQQDKVMDTLYGEESSTVLGPLEFSMLYALPDGWKALAQGLLQELERLKGEKQIHALHESWGSLEADIMVKDASGRRKPAYALASKYRSLSQQTCRECGNPGIRRIVAGMVKVLCGDCLRQSLDPQGKPETGTWLDSY